MTNIKMYRVGKFVITLICALAFLALLFLANERNRLWLVGKKVFYQGGALGVEIGSPVGTAKERLAGKKFEDITSLFNDEELRVSLIDVIVPENSDLEVLIFLDETWRQGSVTLYVRDGEIFAVKSHYGWPV